MKYLVRYGYDITVISPTLSPNTKLDRTLVSDELVKIRHDAVPHSKLFRKLVLPQRNAVVMTGTKGREPKGNQSVGKSKVKTLLYGVAQEIYTDIRNRDWKRQVIRHLRTHPITQQYDCVFTGYPSLSSHLIGEYILENKIAKKWIADFRDPIAYESLNSTAAYWRNQRLQGRFCKKASAITYVTKGSVAKLAEGITEKDKFHYLPNGFDEDDLGVITRSGVKLSTCSKPSFKMAYVGSLYGGKRDLSALFRVIRRLIDQSAVREEQVRLFYAGKDFSILSAQARTYSMQDILVNMGYVAREDSLNIQAQADLVVVSSWNTERDKGVIPGKVYECFLLKKPTLAIVNGTVPGSELGNLVERVGLGLSFDTMVADLEEELKLERFVSGLYHSAISKKPYQLSIDLDFVHEFSYEAIARKLSAILCEL